MLKTGLKLSRETLQEIEDKTLLIMGKECAIEYDFVDEIQPLSSGKYFYTHCMIPVKDDGYFEDG